MLVVYLFDHIICWRHNNAVQRKIKQLIAVFWLLLIPASVAHANTISNFDAFPFGHELSDTPADIQRAAFAIFQVASNVTPTVCNFQTGVATGPGAGTCVSVLPTCDGVTNTRASFESFVSWLVNTWQPSHPGVRPDLLIPAGLNCAFDQSGGDFVTLGGVRKLRISFAGATISGNFFHLGGRGTYQDNTHQALVQTVSAGASNVTLVTSGQTSLFTVGSYALMAGFDLQTAAAYPITPMFFEWLLVTAKDGGCAGTGTVCFSTALQNSYKSTWPTWNAGGAFENARGPATLYAVQPEWDIEIEWFGGTLANTGVQMDATGRQSVFRNVTFTQSGSNSCVFASQNYTFSIVNSAMGGCQMEADKLITSLSMTGTTIAAIAFQSGQAGGSASISGSTINTMVGTPHVLTVSGSTISTLAPGPTYGYTKSINITTSSIGSVGSNPGGYLFGGLSGEGLNNISGLTMSGGVITIPTSYVVGSGSLGNGIVTAWMGPGANVCWADPGLYSCAGVFQISDVTVSGGNTLVHISQSGGLPTWTYNGAGLFVRTHPAVQFSCDSCSNLGFADATPTAPLWSYQKFTFNNASGAGGAGYLWGNISTITANITDAYTGAVGTTTDNIRPNDAINPTTYALNNYTTANINLKQAGLRTLDTSGGFPAVWGNVKSGDTLPNLTSQTWIANQFDNIITNLSGDPSHPYSITVTVQTSQGVVVP